MTISIANNMSKQNVESDNDSSLKWKADSIKNAKEIGTDYTFKLEIVWKNAFRFLTMHLLGLWGLGVLLTGSIGLKTIIWSVILTFISSQGITVEWMFQHKYYYVLYTVLAFLIPIWVPVHYFGESWLNSFLVCYMFRYIFQLNSAWLVNSAAHLYSTRPYDKLVNYLKERYDVLFFMKELFSSL